MNEESQVKSAPIERRTTDRRANPMAHENQRLTAELVLEATGRFGTVSLMLEDRKENTMCDLDQVACLIYHGMAPKQAWTIKAHYFDEMLQQLTGQQPGTEHDKCCRRWYRVFAMPNGTFSGVVAGVPFDGCTSRESALEMVANKLSQTLDLVRHNYGWAQALGAPAADKP